MEHPRRQSICQEKRPKSDLFSQMLHKFRHDLFVSWRHSDKVTIFCLFANKTTAPCSTVPGTTNWRRLSEKLSFFKLDLINQLLQLATAQVVGRW